jgi:hypothetical protein
MRGGLVDSTGNCIGVVMAASGLNTQYQKDAAGNWVQFVPDPYCNLGDHWTGAAWLYASTVPPAVTPIQAMAAFAEAGFSVQLNTAIAAAAAAEKNAWQPPGITAADAVITAAATAIPLTATQVKALLNRATMF